MNDNILKAVLIGGVGYLAYKSIAKATPQPIRSGGGGGSLSGLVVTQDIPAPIKQPVTKKEKEKEPTTVIKVEAPEFKLTPNPTIPQPKTKKESHTSSGTAPIHEPNIKTPDKEEPIVALPPEPSITKKVAKTVEPYRPIMATESRNDTSAFEPKKIKFMPKGADTGIESIYNPVTHETTNVLVENKPSLWDRIVGGISSLLW